MLYNEEAFESARSEIDYAYAKTGFFRKHMDEAQLAPKDIRTREDFSQIPPTEKKHYRKNFPAGVLADGYSLNNLELHRVHSSGTTGERLVTVEVGWIYMQRAMDSLTVNPLISSALSAYPRRHVRYAAPNCSDVECANPNSGMKDRLLKDGTLVLSVYHDLLTTPERMLSMNIEEIEEYQPQMYYTDPTHLAFLARYMAKRGYTPYKAPVLASYTLSTRISRKQISRIFGKDVPVVDAFAMSELGWFAVECPCGNIHLNTKSFYMELLRDGRAAKPGELAELYITTLDNGCTPHIRYRTGDIFRWIDTECPCGSKYPIVQTEGRLRNFIFQEGKVVLTTQGIDEIVGDPEWMEMYKLEQVDENDFVFSYIANEKYEENMEAYIKDGLFRTVGSHINLRMEKVDYISTERSGKFISCVSAVGEKLVEKGAQL
jgi:phenylacetate-CoA ligase